MKFAPSPPPPSWNKNKQTNKLGVLLVKLTHLYTMVNKQVSLWPFYWAVPNICTLYIAKDLRAFISIVCP